MLTGNARSPQAEPVRTRIPDGLKFSPFSSRKKSPSEAINPKLGKSKNENTLRYSASGRLRVRGFGGSRVRFPPGLTQKGSSALGVW